MEASPIYWLLMGPLKLAHAKLIWIYLRCLDDRLSLVSNVSPYLDIDWADGFWPWAVFLIDQQIRNGSNDVHVKNGDFHCSHLIITVCLTASRSCACDRVRDLCIYLYSYLHFTDGSSRKVDFILVQDGNWKLNHCVAFKNIFWISTRLRLDNNIWDICVIVCSICEWMLWNNR